MIVFDGGYVGLAPVPGGRVNVGIVLGRRALAARLRAEGAAAVAQRSWPRSRPPTTTRSPGRRRGICDAIEGAAPVGARVTRRAGADWLLVGDAAGFLDPFTGEGLHRALRSAELAADAIDRHLAGRRRRARRATTGRSPGGPGRRTLVSLLVQAFLGRPAGLRLRRPPARRRGRRSVRRWAS